MSVKKRKGTKKDIPGEELEPTAGEPKEEEIPGSELVAVQSQPKVSLEDVPGKYKKFQ